MRMGLGIRSFRKQTWKEKRGKQKSVSRISLFSCLTDPNKSQMKQEASSRTTEGSPCSPALIHHCQLNLLCPAAAINLLPHISIPEPTDTTERGFKVDWLYKRWATHILRIGSKRKPGASKVGAVLAFLESSPHNKPHIPQEYIANLVLHR